MIKAVIEYYGHKAEVEGLMWDVIPVMSKFNLTVEKVNESSKKNSTKYC